MALKAHSAEQLASSRLEIALKERDRAVTAEKQLAELERKQRNRVAFHQAASSHNADMLKKYLADFPDGGGDAPKAPMPVIQLKPMSNYWKPKRLAPANKFTAIVTRRALESSSANQRSTWMFDDDQENEKIEVIVVSDENENKESLLKSILYHQRKAFGGQDVLVAQTLNQLGELTSDCKKWKQSEEYFREAVEILKETAIDTEQLSAIRLKLVNALEKQGDLKKVVSELQEIKENFQDSKAHEKLNGLLENIKSKVRQSKSDDIPDIP
jgi:tetratricopeptide (TPR) repeat protein